jgi:hypothetical protein
MQAKGSNKFRKAPLVQLLLMKNEFSTHNNKTLPSLPKKKQLKIHKFLALSTKKCHSPILLRTMVTM